MDDNPVLHEITKLREGFNAKYRRPMTADEHRILDLAEKLLRSAAMQAETSKSSD